MRHQNAVSAFLPRSDLLGHAPPATGEPSAAHMVRLGGELKNFIFFVRDGERLIEVVGLLEFDGAVVSATYPLRYEVRIDKTRPSGKLARPLLREFLRSYGAETAVSR